MQASEATAVSGSPFRGSGNVYQRACRVMPAGNTRHTVFHPPHPLYMSTGEGKMIRDVDGNAYVDFNNNFSALVHGHRHPQIIAAASAQLDRLDAVGAPTSEEVQLAQILCDRIACLERLRFTNSGTEAVMLAIKAARAFTNRSRIAKIEGGYHGSYDVAEVSVSPDASQWGPDDTPNSCSGAAGTPSSVDEAVTVIPLNDVAAARRILEPLAGSLAAILIDPVPSNIAYLQPNAEFLGALASICREHGVLLIADEVYSFRLDYAGAQSQWPQKPDITTLGKIIGGGFPIGAVGGRAEVMEVFSLAAGAPLVPHGGTFNANPVTMAAGLKSVELLTPAAIARINELGAYMRRGLRHNLASAAIPIQITGAGSLAAISFRSTRPTDYRATRATALDNQARQFIHRYLLERGQFLAPQLTIVLSTVMDRDDVDKLTDEIRQAIMAMPAELTAALVQQPREGTS